ncbi:hypothetical protein [uncultured Brachyspira sp.]|uniref:hypothetical protein n=1 Tax=uncultured Brachyspira sp. TaxID=221953 RepID=UPI00259AE2EA|nr:hypothetical protein [uncultured Brachyspira sp.]
MKRILLNFLFINIFVFISCQKEKEEISNINENAYIKSNQNNIFYKYRQKTVNYRTYYN